MAIVWLLSGYQVAFVWLLSVYWARVRRIANSEQVEGKWPTSEQVERKLPTSEQVERKRRHLESEAGFS